MKRIGWLLAIVVLVLVLPPMVVPLFVPWSAINCRSEDINITTGRGRSTRQIWYITISEDEFDTPLSVALKGELVRVADVMPWRRVNTFSPGIHHSPHYRFHAALWLANSFGRIVADSNMPEEKRRELARAVLSSWQRTEETGEVAQMLNNVQATMLNSADGGEETRQ